MWRIKSIGDLTFDSNYKATLTDADNPSILPAQSFSMLKRGTSAPIIGGAEREPNQMLMQVQILSRPGRTQKDALVAELVSIGDDTLTLTVYDESSLEWSLEVKPIDMLRDTSLPAANVYRVPLLVPDRIWRKAATPVVWNISASPATQNVNNAGNLDTYPIFRVKPTAAKGGGFAFKSFVPIRNITSNPFSNEALDINNNGSTALWVADTANSNQLNGGMNASVETINLDTAVGAGLKAGPSMCYVDTEQIYYDSFVAGVMTVHTGGRGWAGTTAAIHADNAVVKQSYCRADGGDLRFYLDGADQNLWLDGFNTATSNLWITYLNLKAKVELTLKTAIPSSGSISAIVFNSTTANQTALNSLPGSGILQIGTELFLYTAKSPTQFKVTGITRQARESVEAAHSANVTVYWIEHECWLYSGNPTLTARVNDDTKKPMFDITQSTNTSHVYTEFWTLAGTRAMEFKKGVAKSSFAANIGASLVYPGNHGATVADPATDAGMKMQSVLQTTWKAENGDIFISLYDPAGISDVNWTWERYRLGTYWPALAALRKSLNGTTYTNVISVTTPPTSAVWDGPTASGSTSLSGTYPYIDIRLNGTISAGNAGGVGYNAMLETDSLTLTRVNVPSATINTRATGSYELDFTLESDQGYSFAVHFVCKVDAELVIDCAEREMIYSVDGLEYRSAIFIPEGQADWFKLKSGDNELTYTEDSPGGVEVTVEFEQLRVN